MRGFTRKQARLRVSFHLGTLWTYLYVTYEYFEKYFVPTYTDDALIELHPSLCQLLFESQSPQLVSTVFSGRRVWPNHLKITSPLDWFAIGYCVAHSDSWIVEYNHSDTLVQCLQAFSSGLRYSSTTTHRSGETGSLTEMTFKLPGHHLQQCPVPLKKLYLGVYDYQ